MALQVAARSRQQAAVLKGRVVEVEVDVESQVSVGGAPVGRIAVGVDRHLGAVARQLEHQRLRVAQRVAAEQRVRQRLNLRMAEQREQRIGLRGGQRKHELHAVEDILPGIGIGRGPVVGGVRHVLVTAVDDALRVVLECAQLSLGQQPGNPDEAVTVDVFDRLR